MDDDKVENILRLLTEVNEHIGPVSTLYSTKQVDLHTWQQIHKFVNYILFHCQTGLCLLTPLLV